ncbi:Cd2+/Zn2+-exporting ATPase [Lachnospiraceae bacterium]|nr:Cd2+/Zn2+-exporting ATPase [Lachnospiraceae bacterium]
MNKKMKKTRNRIIITLILFFVIFILDKANVLKNAGLPEIGRLVLYVIPYLIIGYDVLKKAFMHIIRGQAFDESFLMTVATVAAFAIGEFPEATAVMLFYQIGELFQSYAVGKSRESITEMMSIAPESANLEKDGVIEEVDPEDVEQGDIIVIRAGEKVPLDGVVIEGESFLNTAALTGENVPRRVSVGDEVISGCVNDKGTLKVRVTKAYEDSTVAKILELVENAATRKARVEKFITRFARWYTPVVTIGAVLLAVVPPLVLGGGFADWIHRACIFLIVSCPCALVISVPLGFFGGIGAASKKGVLVKGGNFLETISETTTIVFDKTGTLTKGEFKVTKILPDNEKGFSEGGILELAALCESLSDHPIAQSIRSAYGKNIDISRVKDAKEEAGHGLAANVDGKQVLVGNSALLNANGITAPEIAENGTVVLVAVDGSYAGAIVISDVIKEGAAEAIRKMKNVGIRKTVMLTGDREETAKAVAEEIGIDEIHAELLPADKVSEVEKILGASEGKGKVAFVGDGINDAPVLMRSDVGIAMGSLGSDAAIEAADIVLMDDDIRKIASVVKIGRKTMRIVRENITFALAVKFAVIILGALGLANMWEAVFGDVGVTVLAILNSMRALRVKD